MTFEKGNIVVRKSDTRVDPLWGIEPGDIFEVLETRDPTFKVYNLTQEQWYHNVDFAMASFKLYHDDDPPLDMKMWKEMAPEEEEEEPAMLPCPACEYRPDESCSYCDGTGEVEDKFPDIDIKEKPFGKELIEAMGQAVKYSIRDTRECTSSEVDWDEIRKASRTTKIPLSGYTDDELEEFEDNFFEKYGSDGYKETVNSPLHYHPGPHEMVKVAEAWGLDRDAYLWNVLKYISRCNIKHDNPLEDLKKARSYLDRRIAQLKRDGG